MLRQERVEQRLFFLGESGSPPGRERGALGKPVSQGSEPKTLLCESPRGGESGCWIPGTVPEGAVRGLCEGAVGGWGCCGDEG